MSKQVALHEAKNSLSALIQELEQTGAEIVITRHGKAVARLSPARRELSDEERARTFEELAKLQRERTDAGMPPFDWKAAVEEGRE
jgi:prevent-host-death family protein